MARHRQAVFSAVCSIVAIGLLSSSPAVARSKSFGFDFSGASRAGGPDPDGDAGPARESRLNQAIGAGNVTLLSTSALGSWNGTFCDDGSLSIPYEYLTGVVILPDGDQIHRVLDTGRLCFDPASPISTFEVHFVVTGGSGRYEGATGWFMTTGSAKELFSAGSSLLSAIEGRTVGTVEY